jgi:protein-L-isoaspartate O-methyltransferase
VSSNPLPLGADAIQLHVAMLNDRARTSAFLAATQQVVRPGDVVLDIGTGTGIYAIAAARAGARRVYAVEVGPVGEAARRLFDVNGVADRITLLRGQSTEIQLPEPADVLVAELIGDEPLAEGVVGITRDALQRLLKPGARLVPSGVKVFGLPVSMPADRLARFRFTRQALQQWRSWYGIDFGPLAEVGQGPLFRHGVNPYEMREWQALAEPVLLIDVDLSSWLAVPTHVRRIVSAAACGELNALALYFELRVGAWCFYSTRPSTVDATNHWFSPVHVLNTPIGLRPGDRFELEYWYGPRLGRSGCQVRPA